MGHCIQALIVYCEAAGVLQVDHPRLPCVAARQGYFLFPVDAEFIDSVTGARPPQSSDEFMLLTDAFRDYLREWSRCGTLAYVETEYFGGHGGQGAVVFSGGREIMAPEWAESGPINRALKRIGVRRGLLADHFAAFGLDAYRSNDDLIDAAAGRSP